MSKRVRTSSKKDVQEKYDLDKVIPGKYQWLVALAIVMVLLMIVFSPLFFGGKVFQSGDIYTMNSYRPYVQQDKETFTLWNPYIFCGMPSYASWIEFRWFDLINLVYSPAKVFFGSLFSTNYSMNAFNVLILSFTAFLFARWLGLGFYLSLFVSLATTFSTGLIIFLYIGHITKLISLPMLPVILMLLLKFQKKITLLDFLILIVTMHMLVVGWHVQIIFYILFAIAIYFVYYLIRAIRQQDNYLRNQLFKSVGALLIAGIVAGLISFDTYAQLFEYTPYSTRGTESIVDKVSQSGQEKESEFYAYHTSWSFSPGEVLTFIVPSLYGFGNVTYNGPLSNNQDVDVNTYFGQMPFVDVAMYMGVVVFFLGLFSIYANWKLPLIRYLTIVCLIALLISFGYTFPVIFDLMFYYFPGFNKFRVPSMILVLIQMSFPIFAAFGLYKIISLKKEKDLKLEKVIRFAALFFSALFVLSLLFNSAINDWYVNFVQSSEKGARLKQLFDFMSDMFITDLLIAFALLSLTFWFAQFYIQNKITRSFFLVAVLLFVLFDLIRIDLRGVRYVDESQIDKLFEEPGYITAIKELEQNNNVYRILNIKQDGSLGSISQHSNYYVHFLIQDFYGYSGIKPRTYQDYIDVAGVANTTVWRMLNVKYIINDKPASYPGLKQVYSGEKSYVFENLNVLPRAYFVDSVTQAEAYDFLLKVKNNEFDPKRVAFLNNESLHIDKPGLSDYVKVTSYMDEHITIEAKSSGNNFLFLGDTYYPNGWKALIDGKETMIYRVNHGFRGIIVPSGEHKIEFIYKPSSFYIGKWLSLSLSLVLVLGFAFVFIKRKRITSKENLQPESRTSG
jgi:hypothetical protein